MPNKKTPPPPPRRSGKGTPPASKSTNLDMSADTDMKKLTLNFELGWHNTLKKYASDHNTTMKAIIQTAVNEFIRENP